MAGMALVVLAFSVTWLALGLFHAGSEILAATVLPMREKTAVRMTLQSDGRWSIPGGLPILRGSEKIYRNGMRQTAGQDYNLDLVNPHFVIPIPSNQPQVVLPFIQDDPPVIYNWLSTDVIVMDYLY